MTGRSGVDRGSKIGIPNKARFFSFASQLRGLNLNVFAAVFACHTKCAS